MLRGWMEGERKLTPRRWRFPRAVYIQQMFVINLEERRKDHYQMFAHHVITTMLMSFSYVFNYTRVGNAILCTMDLVDIILAVRVAPSPLWFLTTPR